MSDRSHRRKLGQNYLIDPVILFEIERAIHPQKNDLFFEIGPGEGALTDHLMGHNRKVIAMDLDQKNIASLSEKYPKSEHEFIHGDVLFSALGTTLKAAGSKPLQYLVDYTYQYEFAKMASENGVKRYALVSSIGSNENSSFFYPKMKGALEEAIKKLDFEKTYVFQPPFLIRQAELIRTGEKIGIKVLGVLNQLGLLKSQKPLAVSTLAQKMLGEISSESTARLNIYTPKDILAAQL